MVDTPNRAVAFKEARAERGNQRPRRSPNNVDERDNLETSFSTPTNLMGASSKDKWQGETDELGRKIYVAPSGRKYTVGSSAGSRSLPQVARDVYEAIPPMEDWRMPTGEEVASGAKAVAKGAYEGAKHVIETPTNPDATLGDVWGVAGSMPLGVGAARVAGVKAPEDALGIFAGTSAKNADLKALDMAKKLETEGWTPEAIWKNTGWGRGPDNRWLWEIDDSKAAFHPTFKIAPGQDGVKGRTDLAFSHPELYDNYQQDWGDTVTLEAGAADRALGTSILGDFNSTTKKIRLREGPEARSTMIHELSHAVQKGDGASSGGNADYIYNTVKAELENLPPEAQDYLYHRGYVIEATEMINESYDELARLRRQPNPVEGDLDIRDVEQDIDLAKEGLKKATDELAKIYPQLGYDFPHYLNEVSDMLRDAMPVGTPASFNKNDAFKMYEDVPGEYLARKAEGRMDMDANSRRVYYPFRDMPKDKPDQATILKKIADMANARIKYQDNKP